MKIHNTPIRDLKVIEPIVFKDERGYFFESFNQQKLVGDVHLHSFVQDNESLSQRGVLRGMHYQIEPYTQSKLVRVVMGKVLDVAVDMRKNSPDFGKFFVQELSDKNKLQMFIPRGFAHGFVVLSQQAVFQYKVDNYYSKEHERGFRYNSLDIDWQIPVKELILSEKDLNLPDFNNAPYF